MVIRKPIWILLGVLGLMLTGLTACRSGKNAASTAPAPPPAATAQVAPASPPAPFATNGANGKFSAQFEPQFKEIFDLAKKDKWDDAEVRAKNLLILAPEDDSAKRLYDWVIKQRQFQREKHVEDQIRDIDAKRSEFNPTISSLLTENKDRGLPPRKDVRDAIQKIESTPYFPENFGKVIQRKGMLFDMESTQGRMAKILEKEISVHLDNVSLESIIFNIGQAEGINFIADKALPAFKQTLSVNLDKVRLSEFLRYVSRNLDVQFQVGNDLIWIVDAKDPKRLLEETRVYRLKHGFISPAQFGPDEVNRISTVAGPVTTITENQKLLKFVNDNASTTPAIETAIKQFFLNTNSNAKYQIDYEHNLIVARGTREQLEVMDKLIEEFDKPVQQVLIEARFITVAEAAFLELGANWEAGRQGREAPTPQDYTGLGSFSQINKDDYGTGLQKTWTNVFPRVFGQNQLTATLSALQQSGESQTLSAPRLTVINNLPAMINDGKVQYYYEEYTVKQTVAQYITASSLVPSGKPTKITAGVSLFVLASIGGDGKYITLALNPKVNQDVTMKTFATVQEAASSASGNAGAGVNNFDLKLPEYRTQELATRVVIKSGQTVVMGGVLQRDQRTFVESVPLLGSIPIIGAAFRKRTEVDNPRYLLIFVTASLLSENGDMIVPAEEPEPAQPSAKK